MELASKQCEPCKGGSAPLDADHVQTYLAHVKGWRAAANKAIMSEWTFSNFSEAEAFVKKVCTLAEEQNHHPDISFGWGYAKLLLTTHATGGLHENDFIMAAKINELAA